MPKDNLNIKEAIDFLKHYIAGWDPSWFIQLVAIEPVGTNRKAKIEATSVALDNIDLLADFIVKWKHWGIYFGVNPLNQLLHIKAKKQHIAALCYYHLDFDPPKQVMTVDGLATWKVQARQQIADKGLPAPTALIDSGNGLGLFWKAAEPVLHDGGKKAEALEVVNRALVQALGGDKGTANLDRVMRLPGTINRPNWSKKKLYRPVSPTVLLAQTDEVHKEEAFPSLPRAVAKASTGKALAAVAGDLPPRFVELLQGDEDLRARWSGDPGTMDDQSRNAFDMSITSRAVRHGFNDAEVSQILRSLPHGKVHQEGREGAYITDMIGKCRAQRQLSRDTPLLSARRLVAERFTSPVGVSLLRHWNGDFYAWSGGAYCRLAEEDVDARVQAYLEGAQQYNAKRKEIEPFATTPAKVASVRESLGSAFHLDSHRVTPCWLDGADGDDPRDLLVLANGVLNLRTRTLQPHDPRLFTTTALAFAYAPDADPPRAWLAFLQSVWPDDHESIELLQEFMGYVISGDRSQQKALFIIGPRRSGKGTIEKVLGALVGAVNCCSPSLDSLGRNFGLQPMIGKRLALFSDVRLDGRVSQKSVVDKLLSIIGQDDQTIDRKGIPAWTGRLDAAVLATSNELPALIDASGTVASRWKILRMVISFEGREDTGLIGKLLAELPAILNWSLLGLERLQKRGAFVQPQSALELVEQLADLTSPIGEFIREMCVVDPDALVVKEDLYAVWCAWNRRRGREHPSEMGVFGRDLIAALPQLTTHQPGPLKADRRRRYVGIGIKNGACTLEDFKQHPVSDRGFDPVSGQGKGTAAVADLEAARKRRDLLL